jgi:hypothetical protein
VRSTSCPLMGRRDDLWCHALIPAFETPPELESAIFDWNSPNRRHATGAAASVSLAFLIIAAVLIRAIDDHVLRPGPGLLHIRRVVLTALIAAAGARCRWPLRSSPTQGPYKCLRDYLPRGVLPCASTCLGRQRHRGNALCGNPLRGCGSRITMNDSCVRSSASYRVGREQIPKSRIRAAPLIILWMSLGM